MKKVVLLCAGLMALSTTMNAQDKEALKLEKQAIKEAEKTVKKARQEYEMSIPNPQYGRKETNFEKLDGAKALIEQAVTNKYVQDNPETWKVASDIMDEYYKKYDVLGREDDNAKNTASEYGYRLCTYAIKYDSLINIDPKKKDVEKKFINEQYRTKAINPLICCLQVAQKFSNSESQEELALAKKYAALIVNGLEKSHLFSTFTHESKPDWIVYGKAFYAQSLAGIKGSNDDNVEEAYKQLYGTQYESVAYSALINRYRDTNKDRYMKILSYAAEHATGENAPQFAFMYIQTLYTEGKKADCIAQIDKFVGKYADNDNAVSAYLMKGQIYFEDKKYDEAEKVFAEAVAKFPEEERAITMPAKCAWMKAQASATKADREKAIKLFKELETKYPDNPDYWGEPLYILYNNNGQLQLRDKYKKYYNVN
ncbi:MAG: tetratricopeptide repeat protein [Bacteroidaceae bacterium]|nr:tetratricopeptide repeat protein [Bacteroidaceae bacterium]